MADPSISPAKLTIHAYNVGFGDCFLLVFDYPGGARRLLIDFGSTAAPKGAGPAYMLDIANDIREQCKNADGSYKLDAVVATHRHRDHISGFATDGDPSTGKIIASLKPDLVVQPWTEDPQAQPDGKTAASVFYEGGAKTLRTHFLASLNDMQKVAAAVHREALSPGHRFAVSTQKELAFLGDDNSLANRSAIINLMRMGRRAAYVNCGSPSGLESILPGVSIDVLGPPNLEQTQTILKERSTDPNEFWQLGAFAQYRAFWRAMALAGSASPARPGGKPLFPGAKTFRETAAPPNLRWFVARAQRLRGTQLLELVRTLDDAMNNTSVILLFRVGNYGLLFPGDAQIENWAYALHQPEYTRLLADVNLYKVGHHGSLNATPKTLWNLFKLKSEQEGPGRLQSVVSTKPGKHGNPAKNTEVPRRTLIAELEKETEFYNTENLKPSQLAQHIEIVFSPGIGGPLPDRGRTALEPLPPADHSARVAHSCIGVQARRS